MVSFTLLLFLVFGQDSSFSERCDGVVIKNVLYEKEILKEGVENPYQLAVDYKNNILYFSETSVKNEKSSFHSSFLKLTNKDYGQINAIKQGFANAVDNIHHIVYLGGEEGIFKYDFESKKSLKLDGVTHSVWQLFFSNNLYYTTYPEEEAYVYRNEIVTKIPELAQTKVILLAVDIHDNIYFANSSGLFYLNKNDDDITELANDYTLNSFTSDKEGNLYFSTPSAIYAIRENQIVEKLADIDNLYGLAIDSDDNFIIANENSIIKLKSTEKRC